MVRPTIRGKLTLASLIMHPGLFDMVTLSAGTPKRDRHRNRFVQPNTLDIPAPPPALHAQPRNKPCACGSGRKYKRCCAIPGK